ncbi:MAG: hypothetical protein ACE14M_10350 [Terriglobales bacterium]
MEYGPFIVNDKAADPSLAFDCVNLWDRGMQGLTKLHSAYLDAAVQSHYDALDVYRQAFWLVPSLFVFESLGPIFAELFELQTSMASLMLEQVKTAARVPAEIAVLPFITPAGVLLRGVDVASGASSLEKPGGILPDTFGEATAAAA